MAKESYQSAPTSARSRRVSRTTQTEAREREARQRKLDAQADRAWHVRWALPLLPLLVAATGGAAL